MYIHTYIHTYTHTYTHTHIHTYTQTSSNEFARVEIIRLKSHISEIEEEVKIKEEKIKEVTNSLNLLDHEHDKLRIDCDKKDEEIDRLKKHLNELVSVTRYIDRYMYIDR